MAYLLVILLLFPLFLSGCGSAGIQIVRSFAENTNYDIENVSISGPDFLNVVWNSSDANPYTITFDIVAHDASGGVVQPIVSLIDDDGGLRFGDDLLSQEQFSFQIPATAGSHPQSVRLSLGCPAVGTVVGSPVKRDSGEGRPLTFIGPVDSADVFARVEKADGSGRVRSPNEINVDCDR